MPNVGSRYPSGNTADGDAARVGSVLLSIVVPVFNEENAVPVFNSAVRDLLEREPDVELEFVFVNDGSRRVIPTLRNPCRSD
jgi:hypothetical protein